VSKPAADLLAQHAPDTRANRLEAERQRSQEFRERMMLRRVGKTVKPPKLPPLQKPIVDGSTHLVIGDSHSHPDVPNHRYDWLGRYITDLQPDVVIDTGDWWDMESLNTFDRPGSKSFEGRRYWLDIEAGIDAQERVAAQLADYNRGRKKKCKPRLVRCLGNHEQRISRLLEDEPRWESMVGLHDLMSAEFDWEEHAFGETVLIDGIAYCHYFTSGVMGRPIGGIHPAASLLSKQYHPCVQGHSHLFDYSEKTDARGEKIRSVIAGCYFGHDLAWAPPSVNRMYARGLLVLRNVKDGQFDHEWVSIDRIQAKYS